MSKKQTRRSISVSGEVYDRLRAHCEKAGTTCSGIVEELLRPLLGLEGRVAPISTPKEIKVKVVTPVLEKNGDWEPRGEPILKDPIKADLGDPIAAKIFTF